MTHRAAAVVLAALALASCGREPPRLALDDSREITLTLTVTERVSFRGKTPSNTLRVALQGRPGEPDAAGMTALPLRVLWAELSYSGLGDADTYLATDGSRDDPAPGDHLNLARRALLETFVGREVTLHFRDTTAADGGGLTGVEGLDRLTATSAPGLASVPAGSSYSGLDVQTARDGVATLLDTRRIVAGLQAGGLGPPDARLQDRMVELSRSVAVQIDGRGRMQVEVYGRPGEGREGSPVIRLEGRGRGDATTFDGEPGPAPPPEVGPVRIADVEVVAETEYHRDTLRPLRGSVTVEIPYEAGPVVRRGVEFLWVVVP